MHHASHTPSAVLRRAIQIVQDEGLCTLWFKIWGQLCYRRIELMVRELDRAPWEALPARWPLVLGQLNADNAQDYLALRQDAGIAELQKRWSDGHLCFTARLQGRLIYSNWAALNSAWIDYLSREIHLAPDEAYLYEAFTAPDCRGGNIAPTCYAYTGEALRQRGVRRIFAVVLKENKSASRAAIKAGFRRVGTLRTVWLRGWRRSWGNIPALVLACSAILAPFLAELAS